MAAQKFLFLYRTPASQVREPPSPAEMQQMFSQWNAWKEKFKTEIVDVGDGLEGGGKVLKGGVVVDGPFIEAKEVMGGYSIIAAATLDRAVEISRSCPMAMVPGATIEIRQMSGF